jgi:trehalose synthase
LCPVKMSRTMEILPRGHGLVEPGPLSGYEPLIGVRARDRLLKKARRLSALRVIHINSTRQGGGVAEILSSLTPLMNDIGITTEWLVIEGSPEFFAFTKDLHNGLQGEPITPSPAGAALHREVALTNFGATRLDDFDVVIVHDPQPLPLVFRRGRQVWIWQCHIDLSEPAPAVWKYIATLVERYDCAVFSLPEYGQRLSIPQRFIMPAIDPFSPINQEMSRVESLSHLDRYGIPQDLPLVVQAGRFDKWKDPEGVIDAFCMASEDTPATLVLAGNGAADDPEGPALYESVCSRSGERILIIRADDQLLVNALQRRGTVLLQKSLREGFGLTVSEGMWKGKAVVGGAVGGIRHQIEHGHCGFLVANVEEAATSIGALLRDRALRRNMGRRAHQRVRRHFLMTRLLEDWLDLIAALTQRPARSSVEERRSAA